MRIAISANQYVRSIRAPHFSAIFIANDRNGAAIGSSSRRSQSVNGAAGATHVRMQ